MKDLDGKDLLDLYKILKDFIKSLEDRKEEADNDWRDKKWNRCNQF